MADEKGSSINSRSHDGSYHVIKYYFWHCITVKNKMNQTVNMEGGM